MIAPIKNIEIATRVLTELTKAGVREFILCPGARNSPFVCILDKSPELKVYSFFDERSAGFFALGRMATTRRPVAVITTSGTAVAELLPAVIEATYSSLPLVVVSADRPKAHRNTGSPQTIQQVGLFSYYIEVQFDLDKSNSHISFKRLSWKKPVHVNCCFNEPLLDADIPEIKIPPKPERTKLISTVPEEYIKDVEIYMNYQRPLVILGYLPDKSRPPVLEFLKKYKAPIFAEAISGLRGHPDLKPYLIRSGEKMIRRLLEEKKCDSIVRLGGVPTLRVWRDLEDKYKDLPVMSIGYNHFSGLGREGVKHYSSMDLVGRVLLGRHPEIDSQFMKEDAERLEALTQLLKKYPLSEPGLFRSLSEKIGGQSLYLGNSLPIREWDMAASWQSFPARVVANRGANGIDGQVSSFLGWVRETEDNWAIVGDLTALYDLDSLWITPQLDPALKARIVVINNFGGKIFERMFNSKLFLNQHQLQFDHWAKMFHWDYQMWEGIPSDMNLSQRVIIELRPNLEQSAQFWSEYQQLWSL